MRYTGRRSILTLAPVGATVLVLLFAAMAQAPLPTPVRAIERPTPGPSAVSTRLPREIASPDPIRGSPTPTTDKSPAGLLQRLIVADEHPAGYDRDLFRLWIDADGDGCNTRYEVLIAESTTPVAIGTRCRLSGGTWFSAYDGITTKDLSTLDIDHMVPLKEAWDSGAYAWDATHLEDYANDLGDDASLRAVSAHANRSKADRDPAQWLPPAETFACTYLGDWLDVKVRWNLTVDLAEKAAITDELTRCPDPGP